MMEKRLEALDLNLLLALHWLLTEQNVTAAAGKIGISQPAMSRTLGRLRETFDDPLLVKSGAEMALTRRAEKLQPIVALAIERCRDVLRTGDVFTPEEAEGQFRVASVDYSGTMVTDAWTSAVRPIAPNLNLEIVNLTVAASRDLISGKIDLVIMPDPSKLVMPPGVDIDQFVRRKVIAQNYLCAVRKGHPAAKGKLTLKKFTQMEHILTAPEGGRIGLVDRALESKGMKRRISYLTSSFLLALPLLQKTDCLITAPEGLLKQDAEHLITFPPPIEIGNIDLYAGWHPNWTHDERHKWIRTQLFDSFAKTFNAG